MTYRYVRFWNLPSCERKHRIISFATRVKHGNIYQPKETTVLEDTRHLSISQAGPELLAGQVLGPRAARLLPCRPRLLPAFRLRRQPHSIRRHQLGGQGGI